MIDQKSSQEIYDDLWLHQWQDMEKFNPTARHLQRIIENLMEIYGPFDEFIDIGCGIGANIKPIQKKYPNMKITGSDLTPNIIELARKYVGQSSNIHFESFDISKEALNKKYDIILCNQVLEHINDDRSALRNLASMCNKYILVTVPSGKYNSTSVLNGHIRHYEKSDLVNKIENAGFDIKYIAEWGWPFHSIYKYSLGLLPLRAQKMAGLGQYGLLKRSLSHSLFLLFYLNFSNKGENIIILAEKI